MTLTVGALFSGIGGLELGFHTNPAFEIVFQVEKDQACRDILARHWPNVTQYDDVTEVTYDRLRADLGDRADVDVLIGGWPCQDISLAGRRRGLAGERSGLFYEFARIALEVAPLWIVAENVPGLLSSHSPVEDPPSDAEVGDEWRVEETSDLGVVCSTLGDLGYGYAFRVLDAQHFGVPQRRRRVFIVGHLGTPWSAAAEVLFEPDSLPGDPEASGTEGEDPAPDVEDRARADGRAQGFGADPTVAGTLGGGSGARGWCDDMDRAGALVVEEPEVFQCHGTNVGPMGTLREGNGGVTGGVPFVVGDRWDDKVARTLTSPNNGQHYDLDTENWVVDEHEPIRSIHHGEDVIINEGIAQPLTVSKGTPGTLAIPFRKARRAQTSDDVETWVEEDVANTLNVFDVGNTRTTTAIVEPAGSALIVRRLTPVEAERLQGFDDGWTDQQSDSARYKQLGNAVAVPCATWIADRLAETHKRIHDGS